MKRLVCKHFTGIQHDCCEVGVSYKSVSTDANGKRLALPCLEIAARDITRKQGVCAKREYPTAEEIAKEEAEFKAMFEGTMKAREAIVANLGEPWKKGMDGASGVIDCPVCGGNKALRFRRAGDNGHIHASCSTKDCVSWME